MSEYTKLKRLLKELHIAYQPVIFPDDSEEIWLATAPVRIKYQKWDAFTIEGGGYSGVWEYSAEYIARMLDRKFRDGEL